MKKSIAAMVFLVTALGSTSALGQMEPFGKSGSFGFSAERVFQLYYSAKLSAEDGAGRSADADYSQFAVGWGAHELSYPFNTPRIGFDYFVIDSLSVGGALGYYSFNGEGDNDIEGFLLAPRVGYWIPIGGVVGFWPRGGLTYHSLSPNGANNNQSGLALTLEGMFAIGPVEHFAFLAGPTIDWDFIGTHQCRKNGRDDDCDWKYRSIGLQVGLMGWF